jgi:hypothetical protein
MNVYGRRSASRTIHILVSIPAFSGPVPPGLRGPLNTGDCEQCFAQAPLYLTRGRPFPDARDTPKTLPSMYYCSPRRFHAATAKGGRPDQRRSLLASLILDNPTMRRSVWSGLPPDRRVRLCLGFAIWLRLCCSVGQDGILRGVAGRRCSVANGRSGQLTISAACHSVPQAACGNDEGKSAMKAGNKHNSTPHNDCAARPGYTVDLRLGIPR